MKIQDCFYLGIITKQVGFKGLMDLYLDVDNPKNYINLDKVFIDFGTDMVPFFIEKIQLKNNHALVQFQDIDESIIPALIKKKVYLPLDLLPKLDGNKFYFHEIIDYNIIDMTKGKIGRIESILEYPAQPIFQVFTPENKEVLIPIADSFIVEVDRINRNILIDAPEGLIEMYTE